VRRPDGCEGDAASRHKARSGDRQVMGHPGPQRCPPRSSPRRPQRTLRYVRCENRGCLSRGARTALSVRAPIVAVGLILAGLPWVPSEPTGATPDATQCVRPTGVQQNVFSARKYSERTPPLPRRTPARLASAASGQPPRGRTPGANGRCVISRSARAMTATNTRRRLGAGAAQG
jgi:hypothetical protein